MNRREQVQMYLPGPSERNNEEEYEKRSIWLTPKNFTSSLPGLIVRKIGRPGQGEGTGRKRIKRSQRKTAIEARLQAQKSLFSSPQKNNRV